jgi:hypothetical protein
LTNGETDTEPLKMAKPVILSGYPKIYDFKPTALSFCVSVDVGVQIFKSFIAQELNLSGFYTFAPVLNLTGFYKIYDSKPTALSVCVSVDVGVQIFKSFIAQELNLSGFYTPAK